MANITLTNLPTVTGLNGTEPLLGVQSSTSVQITTGQIAALSKGVSTLPFPVSIGGTGDTTLTQYGLMFGNGTNPVGTVTPPTGSNYVLVASAGSAPSWQPTIPVSAGVDSVAFGTTGLTPVAATAGVVSVAFGTTPTAAGIYSPATNQIALSTNSTQRLLIDATGAATFSTSVTSPSITDSGNITFTGTGSRFLADFSNATLANLFAFQSNTTNGNTSVLSIPNGTGTLSYFGSLSSSDTSGTSTAIIASVQARTGEMRINSGVASVSASYAPMTFYTSGAEKMRLDTSGNVGIGNSSPAVPLQIGNGTASATIRFGATSNGFDIGRDNSTGYYIQNATQASPYNQFIWQQSGTERMRIDGSGNVSIGPSGTTTGVNLVTNAQITGATTAYAHSNTGVIQSGVTALASSYYSNISLAAGSFTTTSVTHFQATPAAGGAGSTITNQYGFLANATLGTQGAATISNAYGFYGAIAAATNCWNLYMGGTANNYMAGNFGIGSINLTASNLSIGANITGGVAAAAVSLAGIVQSGVTTFAAGIQSLISSAAASFTTGTTAHFYASPSVGGAGSTITTQIGFQAEFTIGTQGAATVTNAYGFLGSLASGANRWNLYMSGTANNYMAGALGVGTTTVGVAGSINAIGAITFQTTTNNQSYTTTGAGTITISSGTAGSINNMSIGATTASTGAFTVLTAINSANLSTSGQVIISPLITGTIDNMTIGGTTRAAGSFTFVGAGKANSTAAFVNTAAGTNAIAPIQLTSGTNLTTAAAGAIEYDGSVQYFSPAASTRSTVAAEQVVVLNTAYTLTSATGVQKLFNNTTNGAVTLPVGTYQFECYVTLSTLAATGTFGFALAGGATYTQYWQATGARVAAGTAATASTSFNTTANAAITPTSATTTAYMWIRGVLNVTVTGTVIPQFSQTVASAAVVGIGSFFKVSPFSGTNSTTNVTVGNWS